MRRTVRNLLLSLLLAPVLMLLPQVAVASWNGGHDVVGAASASRTWYFAEGTTRYGFNEWICISNPNPSPASARLTFMPAGGEGRVKDLQLPQNSRSTVDVNNEVGPGVDVSVKVEASLPVVAERPMYFRHAEEWTGGHDVIGAGAPALSWYFAEGSCRPGFDTYLCIQNPTGSDAAVSITYMTADGRSRTQELTVGSNSRSTAVAKHVLGEGDDPAHDFSIKVESGDSVPVVVERPMYFNYRGAWNGGHDVLGANEPAVSWYFAEGTCRPGFDPYVCIQNPAGESTSVRVTYMLGDGGTREQFLAVPAGTRATVVVKQVLGEYDDRAHDFSLKVESLTGEGIIVERPMYFAYNGAWTGGHDVLGATAPAVRYRFAEGTCRPGFVPYICVQNPGAEAADVRLTYLLGDGSSRQQLITVAGRARYTVEAKQVLGEGDDAAHDFSTTVEALGGAKIVAERPVYFEYFSTGQWTLTAVGDVNLGGDVSPTLAANGFAYPWSALGGLMRASTLTFANLECTLSYVGTAVPGKTFTFRGDPAAIPFMRDPGGVDVVSQANNHARDFGAQSLVDCLAYLDASGVKHCGAGADYDSAHAPAYLDAKGLRVGFLAYDDIGYSGWYAAPGYPGVCNPRDTARLAADIRAARAGADIVVVSFHWGTERKDTPDPAQTSFARYAIDCGADVVLGHHPHVVQGFELYRGKLIANSLGNFVFNPGSEAGRYTMLTELTLGSRGFLGGTARPVYISNCRPQLMGGTTGDAWIARIAALTQGRGMPARVAGGVMYFP